MKTQWQMVRLDKVTHARLAFFLKGWRGWRKRLANGRRFRLWQQPSLNDAVAELLDRVDKHKERSKRSGSKKAKAKITEDEIEELVHRAFTEQLDGDQVGEQLDGDQVGEQLDGG